MTALAQAQQPADLVLRNGRIVTVDQRFRIVDSLAIAGGRFVAVGEAPAIGPDTQVIDLGGRTVVPGLIDSHLHQLFAALNQPAVDLLGARSIADVQRLIEARVEAL